MISDSNKESEDGSKPLHTISGITFWPIPEFNDAQVAFGAPESAFLPRNDLPDVPRDIQDLVSSLFFKGGNLTQLSPLVDINKAKRAICAWLRSYAPAHESKIATVAYAFWVWTTIESTAEPKAPTSDKP